MPSFRDFLVLVLNVLVFTIAARAEPTIEEAKKLFTRYVEAANAFDSSIADLYSAEAKIENKRVNPDGQSRVSAMPASIYKGVIRVAMPLAKARGDTNTFSDVKYAEEGKNVRITATRFSNLKKYSSPITWLVGPGADGKWVILEESSESRP